MSEAAQTILKVGQARTDEKLPQDAGLRANPAAMSDKILKDGAKVLESQAAKGEADPALAGLAQAAKSGKTNNPEAAEVAAHVKAQVASGSDSQHHTLKDAAISGAAEKLNRKPQDKQQSGEGASVDQAAVEILKDAESELVRKEVKEQGGVIRGSTAAKVQSAADRVREGTAGADPAVLHEIKEELRKQQNEQ